MVDCHQILRQKCHYSLERTCLCPHVQIRVYSIRPAPDLFVLVNRFGQHLLSTTWDFPLFTKWRSFMSDMWDKEFLRSYSILHPHAQHRRSCSQQEVVSAELSNMSGCAPPWPTMHCSGVAHNSKLWREVRMHLALNRKGEWRDGNGAERRSSEERIDFFAHLHVEWRRVFHLLAKTEQKEAQVYT